MKEYTQEELDFFERVKGDYPEFAFKFDQKFAFVPPRRIKIGPPEEGAELLFLHEVGHAILGHRTFGTEVERLKMEVAAWEKARELTNLYGVEFDEEKMQEELDTYRDYLHAKSRCPRCGLTRYVTPDGEFHCPRCEEFILQ